jgi:hypothetical protein
MRRWFFSFFAGLYFLFVEWCLRRMVSPFPIQVLRQRNNPNLSLMIFFGSLTPRDRKLIEIRLNRYKKFFWGRWHLFFESDLPLLQQTMNLFWVKTESHFLKKWGVLPSRSEDLHIESVVFLFQRLRLDVARLEKNSWGLRRRWQRFFAAAGFSYQAERPILLTVLEAMARVLGLDKAEELQFIEEQNKVLHERWNELPPWELAPLLKSLPQVWCWWLPQFPFDWAPQPEWTAVQKNILFATARWEISRGLLQDWQHTGFSDELHRLQIFFEKAFGHSPSKEDQVMQLQLAEARRILDQKNSALMAGG